MKKLLSILLGSALMLGTVSAYSASSNFFSDNNSTPRSALPAHESPSHNIHHPGPPPYGEKGGGVMPVPEPGTMALLGSGLFGLAIYGKRKSGKNS